MDVSAKRRSWTVQSCLGVMGSLGLLVAIYGCGDQNDPEEPTAASHAIEATPAAPAAGPAATASPAPSAAAAPTGGTPIDPIGDNYRRWQASQAQRSGITSNSFTTSDPLTDYAAACDEATGIHVPAFNCNDGFEVPEGLTQSALSDSPIGTQISGSVRGPFQVVGVGYRVETLTSGGGDIWDAADNFLFSHGPLMMGDGTAEVLVNSLTNPQAYAKAGLMFRSALPATSAEVMVAVASHTTNTLATGVFQQFTWMTAHGYNGGVCDRPNVLNQACDPGSKFQVLAQTPDAAAVAHCRTHDLAVNHYGDIAVIQYNKWNGAVCFYQALGDMDGANVPAPIQGTTGSVWFTPSGTRGAGCVGCHDSGGFIRSPYLAQPGLLPSWQDGFDNYLKPLSYVGVDNVGDRSWAVNAPQEPNDTSGSNCNTCLSLGVNTYSFSSG